MPNDLSVSAPRPPDSELPAAALRARFDPARLDFATTAELAADKPLIGQRRALRAMDFGLHIPGHAYNIYVSGVPGTGKRSIVMPLIRQAAEQQPTPDDWCYVNNFRDPDRPRALNLPAGQGRVFQREVAALVEALRRELPRAFQGKDYEERHQELHDTLSKAHARLSAALEEAAKAERFVLRSTPVGFVMVPLHRGKPIDAEEFHALDEATRDDITQREKRVDAAVRNFRQQLRAEQERFKREVDALNRRVALYTSEHLFESLRERYGATAKLADFIDQVQHDVLEHVDGFLAAAEAGAEDREEPAPWLTRYAVNVVVDNDGLRGAPVVDEAHPTYNNLIGRVERKARLGFLYTDFTQIKAGAMLRANGGYLLLNVLDMLRQPFAWDALKRVIKQRALVVEDAAEVFGLVATAALKPEPIPLMLRVVLIGNPLFYYLLQAYDEEFAEIFKVKADFDVDQPVSDELAGQYARFVGALCRDEGLRHFERAAVATVIEHAARLAEHRDRLSLKFSELADLLRESSYWAGQDDARHVSAAHVARAIGEKRYRGNLIEERLRDLIAEGTLRVAVGGSAVGQVNGLSVLDLGDVSFGRPVRITARVFLGQDGIVDIEREAKLGGNVHNKGVLILTGFLAGRYARQHTLSLSATLAFEQSYGTVEGDSASLAELVALLSALAQVPVRQDLAVTGSIDQHGALQAVGGVNEKIEGHFRVCRALGLSGTQGVIIPGANVRHLMLDEEVVAAVAAGRFHVHAADDVDRALTLLTGCDAGARRADGSYPPGSVNAAVAGRLRDMEKRLARLERARRGARPASD
ncbi:MAG TPA: ATP-binding protein [Acidiferrobacterales bacterium]